MPYHALKQRLAQEFPQDESLRTQVAAADDVTEILAALGESYRGWVAETARRAAKAAAANDDSVQRAEQAAARREHVIIEVLNFFELSSATTESTAITRTGPRHLRVRSRATPHAARRV